MPCQIGEASFTTVTTATTTTTYSIVVGAKKIGIEMRSKKKVLIVAMLLF
jgi:hypothetical protein